jgi:hypothetical protein
MGLNLGGLRRRKRKLKMLLLLWRFRGSFNRNWRGYRQKWGQRKNTVSKDKILCGTSAIP